MRCARCENEHRRRVIVSYSSRATMGSPWFSAGGLWSSDLAAAEGVRQSWRVRQQTKPFASHRKVVSTNQLLATPSGSVIVSLRHTAALYCFARDCRPVARQCRVWAFVWSEGLVDHCIPTGVSVVRPARVRWLTGSMAADEQGHRRSRQLDDAARASDDVDDRRWLVAWDVVVLICVVIARAAAAAAATLVAVIPSLTGEHRRVILPSSLVQFEELIPRNVQDRK